MISEELPNLSHPFAVNCCYYGGIHKHTQSSEVFVQVVLTRIQGSVRLHTKVHWTPRLTSWKKLLHRSRARGSTLPTDFVRRILGKAKQSAGFDIICLLSYPVLMSQSAVLRQLSCF